MDSEEFKMINDMQINIKKISQTTEKLNKAVPFSTELTSIKGLDLDTPPGKSTPMYQ